MPSNTEQSLQVSVNKNLLLALINALFVVTALLHVLSKGGLIYSLCANLALFVCPGISVYWFFRKEKGSLMDLAVCALGASVLLIISYILLRLIFRFPVSSGTLLSWIAIVSNALLLAAKRTTEIFSVPRKLPAIVLILFLCVYTGSFWGGSYRIKYLFDCDIERSGTSYGLMYYGKPYVLTDRDASYYYAHPILMHLYSAATVVLSGHIEDVKFYYDHAVDRLNILSQTYKKGDQIRFFGKDGNPQIFGIEQVEGETIFFTRGSPQKIVLIDAVGETSEHAVQDQRIDRTTLNQLRIENSLNDMERHYMKTPYFSSTRMSMPFLFAVTCIMLFMIIFELTRSYGWAAVGAVVYATIPEIYIYSTAGGLTAVMNITMVMLIYYYLHNGEGRSLFFAGLLCGAASQKMIVVPVAIVLLEILRNGRSSHNIKTSLWHRSLTGFAAGLALFWLYGFLTNPGVFWVEHVKNHFIDRIFHIDRLGYDGSYPSVFHLWAGFINNFGLPLFLVSAASLAYDFLKSDLPRKDRRGILFMSFGIGAVAYSIIDWRTHYHLLLVVPPLIIGAIRFFSRQRKWARYPLLLLCLITVAVNIVKLNGLLSSTFYDIYRFLDLL